MIDNRVLKYIEVDNKFKDEYNKMCAKSMLFDIMPRGFGKWAIKNYGTNIFKYTPQQTEKLVCKYVALQQSIKLGKVMA